VFHATVSRAYAQGGDWRDAINAIRPHTQAIWQDLSDDDRRRFLRRYVRFWSIHRHRMAPAMAAWIESLRQSGQLAIVAGGLTGVRERGGALEVSVRLRGSGTVVAATFDAAVNCTGPADAAADARSPLLDRLLAAGTVRPHPLGLGLDTGPAGAVRDAAGMLSDSIFTIGWLRRGDLWESVAIPEIRTQAGEIARRLLG